MAEVAVSFVVEKMGDLLIRKAIFLEGVHTQVDRLKTELKRMQCFLKDADARQQEDESVRNWVSEIRDLACQAEDAIDLYISNVAQAGKAKFFAIRVSKKLVSCWKMGKQIEDIQTKIQDMRRSLETYGIISIGEATSSAGQRLQKLRYTSPFVNEETVGLKQESDGLVKRLVGGDERRRAVSIVGMGGIGKTTLAKKVYSDSRVMHHFQSYRAWVYVSEDCRPRDIFQQILNRLPNYVPTEAETRKIEKFQENELGDFLHEYLRGRRFLVVLDDIWKSEDWKCLARAFPEESNGSRLLLTTRNTEVALQADARSVPHHMRILSEEESWKLFCRTAIPADSDTDTCPPELQELGEKMVKKCAGLPLAIVVLGGLLSSKPRSPTVWENVLNNLQAHFAADNGVDAILSLSYVDLPHNLKSCFLYVGIFPEDGVIPKRGLLHLWTAEGFVPREDGQRMAEEYLNELINRNLVQAAKVSVNERVTECRIHDLVRDLCIKKAKELNFFENIRLSSTSPESRRLAIYGDMKWYASSSQPSTPYIRSLLFFKTTNTLMRGCYVNFSENRFKLLRVLDFGDVPLRTTIRFGKLIHLRYLRFNVDEYPITGLTSLRNRWGGWWVDHLYLPTSLQTLILWSRFSYRHSYPAFVTRGVEKLENLQHLSLSLRVRGVHEPLRIETLKNLQTLAWICWRDWLQNDTSRLTSLRKLRIKVDDDDVVEEEAAGKGVFSDSIAKCENLRSLYLEATSARRINEIPCFVMNSWLRLSKLHMAGTIWRLPKAHEFPPSLTQVTLEDTTLGKDSMLILEKLPKLLTFRCIGQAFEEHMQVSKDGFPQLRNLLLSRCRVDLTIAKGGMSNLTRLQIYRSPGRINGHGDLLHLRKIDVD